MLKIKKLIILTFIFLFAGNISATTLSTSTSLDVLYVNVFHNGKWSGWNNHAEVSKGDKLWFQLHSYANGGNVESLVSKLENIEGRSFLSGSTHQVSGFVDSASTVRINDSVSLTFKENVKVNYAGYKWATKLKGPNPESDESVKALPLGQGGISALSSAGARLGNLSQDYRSNLLLFFSTGGFKTPINGKCLQQKNKCSSGKFLDIKDDSKYYKWRCAGIYNGGSENCFLEKIPKDAVCSSYVNKCKTGYFTDIKDDNKSYIWKCNGLNGGESLECKTEKKPISGVCGKSLNKCSRGSFSDTKDNYEKKLWSCKGLYGGKDISCSIQKMCPCTLDSVQRETTDSEDVTPQGSISDLKLFNENKELKLELKKISNIKNSENSTNEMSLFHWILGLIYTLIIIAITVLIVKRKKE